MVDDPIRAIIEAFKRDLERVLEQAKGKRSKPEALKELLKTLDKLREALAEAVKQLWSGTGWRWDTTLYGTVETIKRSRYEMQPVIIRASVRGMSDILSKGDMDYATAKLADTRSSDTISTGQLCDPLLTRLQEERQRNAVLDFLGFPLFVMTKYIFIVVDLRPVSTALQLVMATPGETDRAEQLVGKIAKSGSTPLKWVRREVIDLVGIKNIASGTILDEMLEAMILQAFSDGYVRNAMGRVHTLVVGPPASGKKLLVDAARILNSAFQHAGQKLTPAGLVGRTRQQKGGTFVSEPGLLPLAHRGTLAIEDFHALKGKKLDDILGHLSQLMEDGFVLDSTTAKAKLTANTSLHLDLNRASDLFPHRDKQVNDLEMLPMNILSRFDVIYDYPKDTERMFETAQQMLESAISVGPDTRHDRAIRVRDVQLVIALLRDRHPIIDVPTDTRECAKAYMKRMKEAHRSIPRAYDALAMFVTRMVNSLLKLAAAIARAHGRDTMTPADIDRATLFVDRKLDFLRKLLAVEMPTWANAKRHDRMNAVLAKYGDASFTGADYVEAADTTKSTAYRDIAGLIEHKILRKAPGNRYEITVPQHLLPAPEPKADNLAREYDVARGRRPKKAKPIMRRLMDFLLSTPPTHPGESNHDRLLRFFKTKLSKAEQRGILSRHKALYDR